MPLSALIKLELGGFTRNCKRSFFFSPGPSGPRLIHHCKDLSEAWSGGSPAQRGWKMSGTWGPQSQDLLGSAPRKGVGSLVWKPPRKGLWGGKGARLQKNGTSPWLWCPGLPFRALHSDSPIFAQPRDQLRGGGKLTPQRSRHLPQCWGGDSSEGGNGVSKQLWKVSKFRYLCIVSGTCILAPLRSLPPSAEGL